jgi:transposase InsO family protein
LELNLRFKPRKRLKRDVPDALAVPEAPNITWSMDFTADRLEEGRAFRLLNMLDDFDRESLDIEEAQHFATQWLWTYNNNRQNMGIGGITPAMKLKMAA